MSDNSWYEKGELPPVGAKLLFTGKCEEYSRVKDFSGKEVMVLSVFKSKDIDCIAFNNTSLGIGATVYSKIWFEPIKTERELAIEAALEEAKKTHFDREHLKKIAGLWFDAGLLRSKNES